MKVFKDYSTHIRSTPEELLQEYFLPLLAEFAKLAGYIFVFRQFKAIGLMTEEPSLVGEELTRPTFGRLLYGV